MTGKKGCRRDAGRVLGLAIATQAGLLIGAAAIAQDSSASSGGSNGVEVLDEVVVTAQRRSERAVDVPVAITALNETQLREADIKQLSDIARVTPALRFDYSGGPYVQPTIRGVGSDVIAAGVGPNIGIYVDGFYSPDTVADDFNLVNVEGVQILKGPQGTLFGRNTTGGAILITTKEPSQQPGGEIDATYGSFNAATIQGYLTAGVAPNLAVDLNASYRRGDGYVHDIVTGSNTDGLFEDWSARTGIRFDPAHNLSFLLHYEHSNTSDPTQEMINAATYLGGGPNTNAVAIPGAVFTTKPGDVALNAGAFHLTVDQVQLTSRLDLNVAMLTSYTQYRKDVAQEYLDQDASSVNEFNIGLRIVDELLSQEFLLASANPGPLQWTTGVFLYRDSYHFNNVTASLGGDPYFTFTRNGSISHTYAAYADATYEVVHRLFVTAGFRVSHDVVDHAFFYIPVGALLPNSGPQTTFNAPSVNYTHAVPRLVLRYKPTDDSSVYVSFSQGFKSPFVNVGGESTALVKAETITDYELGYKYAHGPLSFDLDTYHYDYNNLQVATYTGAQAIVNNAASAKVNGVEAQLSYAVSQHFDFNTSAAYTDAKYKKYPDAAGYLSAGGGFPGTSVDASGFEMQRAPPFTANLGARYRLSLFGGQLVASANLYHTSKFYFDAAHIFPQSSYEVLGLRTEWTNPADRYTVSVFGDNVTNSRYRLQVLGNQLSIAQVWSAPATWGVSVRTRF